MFRTQLIRTALVRSIIPTRALVRVLNKSLSPQRTVSTPQFGIRLNSSSTPITTDGLLIPKSVLELSVSDYHQYADETLESMIVDLEEVLDTKDCGDMDVELSVSQYLRNIQRKLNE